MNLDIERIAITLQNVSPLLGEQVAGALDGVLRQRLSALKLRGAGSGAAQLDLGVIDAPAGTSAQALTDLIAARLVDWIARDPDQGQAHADPAPPREGR